MDLVVNYPARAITAEELYRRPHRHGHHRTYLHLLAVFGILAFIFSATSPYDDDIQQEFCQTSHSKHCVLANYKTLLKRGTSRTYTARYALSSTTPQVASYELTAAASVTDDEIKDRVCSRATGDRSPPVEAS